MEQTTRPYYPLYLGKDLTKEDLYFFVKSSDGTGKFLRHSTDGPSWCLSNNLSSFLDSQTQPSQEVLNGVWAFVSKKSEVSGVGKQPETGIHFGSGRHSTDDRRAGDSPGLIEDVGGRPSAVPDLLGESGLQCGESSPVKRRGRPPGSKNKPKPQSEQSCLSTGNISPVSN